MLAAIACLVFGLQSPKSDIERAAELWNEFQMPIPSASAKPILVDTGYGMTLYAPGFLERVKDQADRVFVGTRIVPRDELKGELKDIDWDSLSIKDLMLGRSTARGFP